MKKQKMEQYLENKMLDCYWLKVAQSTSPEGIQFRFQNPQINFHNCRENCPMMDREGFCNQYISTDELNLERGFIFEI